MIAPHCDKDESVAREIAKAVAIAGLSALVTGLAQWAVEKLRKHFGDEEKKEPTP